VTGFNIQVESEEFARIMTNALAFFPARSVVDFASLRFWPDRIEATATDTYTMGRDWCSADTGLSCVTVELERDGWRAIEEVARKDSGNWGRLDYYPGDCLVFSPGVSEYRNKPLEPATAKDMTGKPWPCLIHELQGLEFWQACDELLERYDDPPTDNPDVLCFDPALFGRFQKVKLSKAFKGEKVLDFYYQGKEAPMLAKVGPTFRGLIMPINRSRYAENNSNEGLW
jgi:hypothetical protein